MNSIGYKPHAAETSSVLPDSSRPIASITIGPRFRIDQGDISDLAHSIAETGPRRPAAKKVLS